MKEQELKIYCSISESDWYKKYCQDHNISYSVLIINTGSKQKQAVVTVMSTNPMVFYHLGMAFGEWHLK